MKRSLVARFELRGQPATIQFVSEYRNESDFQVSDANGVLYRVRRINADNRAIACTDGLTNEEAATAINAYADLESSEFERWRQDWNYNNYQNPVSPWRRAHCVAEIDAVRMDG
jgi:hypothetical protein